MHTEFYVIQGGIKTALNTVTGEYVNAISNGEKVFDRAVIYYKDKDNINVSAESEIKHLSTCYLGDGECCFNFSSTFNFDYGIETTELAIKSQNGRIVNIASLEGVLEAGNVEVLSKVYVKINDASLSDTPEKLFEYLFSIKNVTLTAQVCKFKDVKSVGENVPISVERGDGKVIFSVNIPESIDGKYIAILCDKAPVLYFTSPYVRVENGNINKTRATFALQHETEISGIAGSADLTSAVKQRSVANGFSTSKKLILPFVPNSVRDQGDVICIGHKHGIFALQNEKLVLGGTFSTSMFDDNVKDFCVTDSGIFLLKDKLIKVATDGSIISETSLNSVYDKIFYSGNYIFLTNNSGFSLFQATSSIYEVISLQIQNAKFSFDLDTLTLTAVTQTGINQYHIENGINQTQYECVVNMSGDKFGGRYGRATVLRDGFVQVYNLISKTNVSYAIKDVFAVSSDGTMIAKKDGNSAIIMSFNGEDFVEIGRVEYKNNIFFMKHGILNDSGEFYKYSTFFNLVDVVSGTHNEFQIYSESPYFPQEQHNFIFEAII